MMIDRKRWGRLASGVFLVTGVVGGCMAGATIFGNAYANQHILVDTRNTRIAFLDACTNHETAMMPPEGVRLLVQMWDLKPGQPLHVDIDVTPQEGRKGDPLHWDLDAQADSKGTYTFFRKIDLPDPDDVNASIWNARVRWQQPGLNGSSGASSTGIYLLRKYGRQFFRVDGPPVCIWETPAKIDSEYYYNRDQQTLSLSRSYSDTASITETAGLGLGTDEGDNPADNYGHLPLMKHGWFFAGWYKTWEATTEYHHDFAQTWNLLKGQGGFFTQRLSYIRVPVAEFTEGESHGCRIWKESRHGELDVGKVQTDFAVVPQSKSTDIQASEAFIERMRPTINTCARLSQPDPRTAQSQYIVTGPDMEGEQAMYFYPTNR